MWRNKPKSHSATEPTKSSVLFDWLFVLTTFMFIAGMFTDTWAHNHIGQDLDPFFTPYHALFYGGFFLSFLMVIARFYHDYWSHKKPVDVPKSYMISLIGSLIVFIGGFGDMAWHLIFGLEEHALEVLISPTHLLIVIGACLFVSGPWLHWLEHCDIRAPRTSFFPALASFGIFMAFFTVLMQWANPFVYPLFKLSERITYNGFIYGGGPDPLFVGHSLFAAGVLIYGMLFVAPILYMMRRYILPFGSYTFLLGFNVFLHSFNRDSYEFVFPALCMGVLLDIILWGIRQTSLSTRSLIHVSAFLIPTISLGAYFLPILFSEGTWISVHVWTGIWFMVGLGGLLLSMLIIQRDEDLAHVHVPQLDVTIRSIGLVTGTCVVLAGLTTVVLQYSPLGILEYQDRVDHVNGVEAHESTYVPHIYLSIPEMQHTDDHAEHSHK